MTRLHVLAIAGALLVLYAVYELLRRRALREKYATLWIAVGVIGLVLAIWPPILNTAARIVGFTLPANLLFLGSLLFLVLLGAHLSLEVSQLEEESRTLAEEIALLRLELRQRDDPQLSER
jgi:hypothetical protein